MTPGAHLRERHGWSADLDWSGAVIKQGTTIGARVMVGAGAIVLGNIPDGQTVVGNPARSLQPSGTLKYVEHRFLPWPSFTEEEADAVRRVLLQQGQLLDRHECRAFEKEFAAWCGTSHAVALANGTLALDVALKALGIGPGDEVIVTPRTFIATASCVVNAGATPVFADVEPDSGNISAPTIGKVLTPRTKAVICVHLAGWPCDMDPIMALADEHGFKVIEDCAQAHGARYKGRRVGSIGHVGAWSFCQDKIMTTGGEGGMVTTDDEALWSRDVVVQGPRQELGGGLRARAPAGLPLAARELRHQLAHARDAGGRSAASSCAHGRWTARAHRQRRGDLGGCRRHPRGARAVALPRLTCCTRTTSATSIVRPEQLARRLEPRPHRRGHQRARRALLPGLLLGGLPREGLRRHRLASRRAPAGRARARRDQPDVPGASRR